MFLALQNTYEDIEIAISNSNIIETIQISKHIASKELLLTINALLQKHHFKKEDIEFIALNAGPGPFTTLRVVIATANGISFASGIPLIGIDGLDAFIEEYKDDKFPVTVALLNAFNNDAYFAIQDNRLLSKLCSYGFDKLTTSGKIINQTARPELVEGYEWLQKNSNEKVEKGWNNIDLLLSKLKEQYPNQTIRFIGNGSKLFEVKIKEVFGDKAFMPEPMPQTCSVKQIAKMGYKDWQGKKGLTNQILPLYLKDAVVIRR